MINDIAKVLVSEEEIKSAVARLAKEIDETYKNSDKTLLVVGILKGSIVFMADLIRSITAPMTIDFMQVSSYGSGTVSGDIDFRLDLKYDDLSKYDVLVVEDILDTGNTLSYLLENLQNRGANSVKLCVLLNKPERRIKPIDIDFEGIVIPDEFVVGYGLDFNEKYRSLPYIGVLKPEVYAN